MLVNLAELVFERERELGSLAGWGWEYEIESLFFSLFGDMQFGCDYFRMCIFFWVDVE